MKKLRSDSAWAKLTPEQNEKLGYAEVLKRAQAEFGIVSSPASLARFYQLLARERRFEGLSEAAEWMNKTAPPAPEQAGRLNAALTAILGQTAYQLALEAPDKLPLKELALVMRSFLQLQRQKTWDKRLKLEKDRNYMRAVEWALQMRLLERKVDPPKVTAEQLHEMVEMIGNEMPHYEAMMRKGSAKTPPEAAKKA